MLFYFGHHKHTHRKWIRLVSIVCITAAVLFTIYGILFFFFPEHIPKLFEKQESAVQSTVTDPNVQQSPKDVATPDWVTKDFLTPNEYSRPQTPLFQVNSIVIHYVGNPGTTAQNNRNYFEALSITKDTYASSHFVIGLDGEIIQCIPLNEIAYCSNDRNDDTISIECCHPSLRCHWKSMSQILCGSSRCLGAAAFRFYRRYELKRPGLYMIIMFSSFSA